MIVIKQSTGDYALFIFLSGLLPLLLATSSASLYIIFALKKRVAIGRWGFYLGVPSWILGLLNATQWNMQMILGLIIVLLIIIGGLLFALTWFIKKGSESLD